MASGLIGLDKSARRNSIMIAAMNYACNGLPIFPCKLDKTPYTARGFKDATSDANEVTELWTRWPGASIGMPTGTMSGRFVIDVDPRHNGHKSLAELQSKYGPLPQTLESKTGGGGRHLFFECRGLDIRNSAGVLGVGLDVRGNGGYVILPPSPHESGNSYEWVNGGTEVVLDMPQWLESLVLNPQRRKTVANGNGEKIPKGQRNMRMASYAGTFRRNGDIAEEIEAKLRAYNDVHCDPPLSERDLRTIAKSVSRYKPAVSTVPGRIPITETSNAERLCTKFGADLRYCSDRDAWCVWNGQIWCVSDTGGVMRRTHEVTRDIYLEAANETDDNLRKALAGWAKQSESRRTQENSAAIARYFKGIEVRNFSSVFDTHPLLLNAENGTIDLRTGELSPHSREDFLTKVVPIAYESQAKCPKFFKFLHETLPASGLAGYLSRFAGYCLTGLTSEQSWFLFYGLTASGKSTLINLLHGLLGPYALALPENYFLVTKNTSDFATANLAGVRLATCVETNEGRRLDVAKIKMLTGEDMISAALKYENYFEFRLQAKLVLATNHRPHVPATDDSIWRRLKVVPFNFTVPEDKRIPELAKQLLEEEGRGILQWAVLGARAWLADRLDEPKVVRSAVNEYRTAEDVTRNFLDECCVVEASAQIPRKELFTEYARWSKENRLLQMTTTKFARELHRLKIHGDQGKRFWFGVRVG
jgi:putative DNA primase/helicase